MSPFAGAFEALVANGYSVLPISPDSKAPSEWRGGRWRGLENWLRFRDTRAPDFILRVWAGFPDANIGIVTGTRATATHIVACVDFDTDDPDHLDTMAGAIPPSPVMKRGRRGWSAFYLVESGTTGYRTPICELLTDTRQTVIPPSIHPDTGQPYRWTGSATLMDVRAADLPVLSEDDLAKLRDTIEHITKTPIDPVKAVMPITLGDDATPWRRLNTTAFSNLDAWVPKLELYKLQRSPGGYKAVATWRASSSGRPLEKRGRNLSITAAGAKDFGTGDSYTALNLVQTALGYDLDTAFQWLSECLGLVEKPIEIEALPSHDPETGEILEPAPAPAPPSAELPDHLTRVPGLVGDVVDWIVTSARRPNRALALGAAIPIIGTLMGQAIAGPTISGTHLYIVALAPSGAGKDHPLRSIMTVLKGCNASKLVGPDEFISMPAVISFLSRSSLSVCPIDEIGAFLKRLCHPKASAYEKSVTKMLRTVWGASFHTIMTPEWAQKAAKEIHNPAMSIYGVSTPEEFFASLTGEDVVNGFLNRFLLITSDARTSDVTPALDPLAIPRDLALALARFYQAANQNAPEDLTAAIGDGKKVKRMGWGEGAEARWNALRLDLEAIQKNKDIELYFARTGEMAVRLATIRAAGRGLRHVESDDMAWGAELALWSARKMAAVAGAHIAESDTHRLYNRVLRLIDERGGRISHRDLQRVVKIKTRDLRDVTTIMEEAGEIVVRRTMPAGGGPVTVNYERVTNDEKAA